MQTNVNITPAPNVKLKQATNYDDDRMPAISARKISIDMLVVNGVSVKALIDSGSPYSIVSQRFLKWLADTGQFSIYDYVQPDWSVRLVGASREPLRISARAYLSVQRTGWHRVKKILVHMQENAVHDFVLGTDSMALLGYRIIKGHFVDQMLTWRDFSHDISPIKDIKQPLPIMASQPNVILVDSKEFPVRIGTEYIIPARSVQLISIPLPSAFWNMENRLQFDPTDELKRIGAMVSKVVNVPLKRREIFVPFANKNDIPIRLLSGTQLGTVSQVQMPDDKVRQSAFEYMGGQWKQRSKIIPVNVVTKEEKDDMDHRQRALNSINWLHSSISDEEMVELRKFVAQFHYIFFLPKDRIGVTDNAQRTTTV